MRVTYYNTNKLKQTNPLQYWSGNGRPYVLSGDKKKAIGQYIRRNSEIKTNKINEKLSTTHYWSVFASIISHHLLQYDCRHVSSKSTLTVTCDNKIRWVQRVRPHENDDFTLTVYTDKIRHIIETSKSLKILMNLNFF